MTTLDILILSAIQGITELLPISSSAHLVLVGEWAQMAEHNLVVDIALHAGTLVAATLVYARRLVRMAVGCLQGDTPERRLVLSLLIAVVPTVVGGLLLSRWAEAGARSMGLIAANSIVFGGLLWFADSRGGDRDLATMTKGEAFLVGALQVLSMVPGVSRAGITITILRYLGFSRERSVFFSILLSLPTILGAVVLVLARHPECVADAPLLAKGAGFSFVFTLLALAFLVHWIRRFSFKLFALYRIALGIVILAMLCGR